MTVGASHARLCSKLIDEAACYHTDLPLKTCCHQQIEPETFFADVAIHDLNSGIAKKLSSDFGRQSSLPRLMDSAKV